jgi:hypothetical protein
MEGRTKEMTGKQPPKVIYLQFDPNPNGETTWCEDRINDDDIEYVRTTSKLANQAETIRLLKEDNKTAIFFVDLIAEMDPHKDTVIAMEQAQSYKKSHEDLMKQLEEK